jgi:hypothetical protein
MKTILSMQVLRPCTLYAILALRRLVQGVRRKSGPAQLIQVTSDGIRGGRKVAAERFILEPSCSLRVILSLLQANSISGLRGWEASGERA